MDSGNDEELKCGEVKCEFRGELCQILKRMVY